MKFFIDGANVSKIRELVDWFVVDGVTTNPSLLSKEEGDPEKIVREICEIVNGPVSVEVVSTDAQGMVEEARRLSSIHPNVVVKIPFTKEGIKAIKQVSKEGIDVNTTLIFNPIQALIAARAGAKYVSPFIGRLDDVGHDGVEIVRQIVEIFTIYDIDTQVIAASIRHPKHVLMVASAGAHIATIPVHVVEKMINHPLTDVGLKKFLEDWKKKFDESVA